MAEHIATPTDMAAHVVTLTPQPIPHPNFKATCTCGWEREAATTDARHVGDEAGRHLNQVLYGDPRGDRP